MTGPRHQALFWALLGGREQAVLATLGRPHRSAAGATLCLEGEPSTHVFILLSGWVKIVSVSGDGREMLLALRGPGDIIGEIAGEITGYRTATVRAAGTLQSLIVAADRFERFLDQHPAAAHAYRRAMAERRRSADETQRGRALTNGHRSPAVPGGTGQPDRLVPGDRDPRAQPVAVARHHPHPAAPDRGIGPGRTALAGWA